MAVPNYGPQAAEGAKYALQLFGKPQRQMTCDCERSTEPNLLQSIYLQNDAEVVDIIRRNDGWIAQLSNSADRPALIRELYLRTVCRAPSGPEAERCTKHLTDVADLKTAMQDLLLALINTREFISIR